MGGRMAKHRAPARDEDDAAPPPPPAPMQQANGVRAGEWDDNANYRDYVKWLSASSIKGKLDIAARQFLVVTDKDGHAVPNCTIDVKGNGKQLSLVTMASGRAPCSLSETVRIVCLTAAISSCIEPVVSSTNARSVSTWSTTNCASGS